MGSLRGMPIHIQKTVLCVSVCVFMIGVGNPTRRASFLGTGSGPIEGVLSVLLLYECGCS